MPTCSRHAFLWLRNACHGTRKVSLVESGMRLSGELSTPVADDEPPEPGEAGAPSTLASSVRFYCTSPLMDSSTTPASGA